MKRLLLFLLLAVSAQAQPILRQSATTNSPPRLPPALTTHTSPLFPISVLNPDGSGTDREFQYTPGFSLTQSNMTVPGNLSISGRTNRLTISSGGTLLLDGVEVASNTTTNTYNSTFTTNQFFVSGKGNTLIITNYIQFPFTTLTMSGSNVSAMDISTGSAFKVTLTNNAFLVSPTGLPGTNLLQSIQLWVKQDATGGRTLMATNGGFVISGAGESTNAVIAVTTNANAITVLTFASSPFTATKLYGVPTPFVP